MALTATAVYTFAGTLWAAARATLGERRAARRAGVRGPGGRGAGDDPRQPRRRAHAGCAPTTRRRDYAWFDPSRVIPDTINEFPSFSFMLGDLHAHVIALPFTVLAIAFALQVALHGPRGDLLWRGAAEALAAALAIGSLYAINSWSYPVVAGLLAAAVVVWLRAGPRAGPTYSLVWLGLVLVASFALILPFVLNFDPESRGIGVVLGACAANQPCAPRRPFGKWLGDTALIYGILLWPLVGLYARRLLDSPNRWRWLGWGFAAAVVGGSLLASANLTGAGLVAVLMLIGGRRAALAPELSPPLRFLWVLVAGGFALLLIPELLYLRDAFDNGALERMNTVFKAGYQAYLLLGLAAGCALPWAAVWIRRAGAVDRLGGGRGGPAAARLRLPVRGRLRAHRRLRQRADARRPEVAEVPLARRSGRDRLDPRPHRRRRGRAGGRRRRLLRVRPRAASPPSPAARP